MGNSFTLSNSRASNRTSMRQKPCDPHHKHQEELKKEEELYKKMEQDRREGRALLRRIDIKSDDEDWKAVIEKADSKKKKHLKKLKRQERKWRRQNRKRRRKVDAEGSFSINLLTMKQSIETEAPPEPGTFEANLTSSSNNNRSQTYRGKTARGVQRWKQSVVPMKRHRSDATAPSVAEDEYGHVILEEDEYPITVIHASSGQEI